MPTKTARAKPATASGAAGIETKPGKAHRGGFLREFLRTPGAIGAVTPSSRFLGARLIEGIDFAKVRVAVEYGPGTGPYSDMIASRMAPGSTFFAVEVNERFADIFRKKHPHLKLHHRSAADIGLLLAEHGLSAEASVDVIFSGIPWASLPHAVQVQIMDASYKALKPGGQFRTLAYYLGLVTPSARKFHKLICEYFVRVERSEPVFRNMPPAFIYRCWK